jgi:hypothetical protein
LAGGIPPRDCPNSAASEAYQKVGRGLSAIAKALAIAGMKDRAISKLRRQWIPFASKNHWKCMFIYA